MKVKRIVVDQDKGGAWQFRAEHDTGEAHYTGYASAAAAAESAGVWACEGREDLGPGPGGTRVQFADAVPPLPSAEEDEADAAV